jgi:hypothetical protein
VRPSRGGARPSKGLVLVGFVKEFHFLLDARSEARAVRSKKFCLHSTCGATL